MKLMTYPFYAKFLMRSRVGLSASVAEAGDRASGVASSNAVGTNKPGRRWPMSTPKVRPGRWLSVYFS